MVVKWQFYDPNTAETYQWEINPNDDGLPGYKKTITTAATSAPDGKVILMEGRDEVQRGEFSGVTLSEAQHLMFIHWFNKRNQIRITDDLGRSFWIIIESYFPKRRLSINHPYKHDYTMSYIIVNWES